MCGGREGPWLNFAPHEALCIPDRFPSRSAIETDKE